MPMTDVLATPSMPPMPAKLASSLTIFKDAARSGGFGLKEVATQVEERLGEVVARE
jgi:hypothetical protein